MSVKTCSARRVRFTSALTATLMALLIVACSGGDNGMTASKAAVASIRITPSNPTVDLGHVVQLSGAPLDANGATLTGRTVTWSVPSGALVSVSLTGAVTGLAPGVDTVFALSEGITQPVAVTVAANNLSISVVPPTLTLAYLSSVQLVGTLRNQFGEAIPGTISWTSETPAVISVSSSGLVTGLAIGAGTVRARLGSFDKVVPVTVVLTFESLIPVGNAAVSGTKDFAEVTIRSGASVTVSGATIIRSYGPVTIDGAVNSAGASCTNLSVESRSTVTITGTVDIGCGLRIVAPGGFSVRGATIRTKGRQLYTNDTTLTDASFNTVSTEPSTLACDFSSATMTITAQDNAGGAPWDAACRGDITLAGPTLARAQDGAFGVDPISRAGLLRVRATRDIIATSGDVVLATGDGGVGFSTGVDGDAPPAKQSLQTIARAGAGGTVGSPNSPSAILRAAGKFSVTPGAATLTLQIGNGGAGGVASAFGFTGQDATLTTASQNGGEALAFGGVGGNVYQPQLTAGENVSTTLVRITGGNAGTGGDAFATGGTGGDGSVPFPDGAAGGDFHAFAGNGGATATHATFGAPSLGGRGGMAALSGGQGGNGAPLACAVPSFTNGGHGGQGGKGEASPGLGGLVNIAPGALAGTVGAVRIANAGNGGNGGSARIPGFGGAAGVETTVYAASSRILIGTLFTSGQTGAICP